MVMAESHEQLRRRMLKYLPRMIRELEDFIATAQWWNSNRPDAAPLDCEPEQVLLPKIRKALKCVADDVQIPDDCCRALGGYMIAMEDDE